MRGNRLHNFIIVNRIDENKTIRFIELNSPGGIIDAAMGIDRYLIEEGISTIVVEKCESACVLIAIGDKQLHVNQPLNLGFTTLHLCA